MKYNQKHIIKKCFLLSVIFILLLQSLVSASTENPLLPNTQIVSTNSNIAFTSQELLWLNKKQPINYVYDPDWPPFEWTNGIQEHVGIIADILSIITDKTGIEFRPVQTKTWNDAVKLAKANKVDMYSAVAITEERKKYLKFTSESIYSYLAVFISDIKNNDYTLDNYDHLEDKKIALIKGNLLSKTVVANYPKAKYIYVDSAKEGFNMVSNKQADLFAINAATATYFINRNGYSEIKVYKKINFIFNLKIGLQKNIPNEVISILDKTIRSIGKNQLSDIFYKWTIVKENKINKLNQTVVMVTLMLLIVTIFILLYMKLKQFAFSKGTERLELALLGSQDGLWDWNLLDDSIYFSDRLREILGYSKDEFPNDLLFLKNLAHPDDLPIVTAEIKKNIRNKIEYFESSYRLKNKQGHWHWTLTRGKTHYNKQGKAVRMTGTFTDIQVRKELEFSLNTAKNKYQRLVEDIGAKFLIYSHLPEEGSVTYLSGSVEEIFALKKEDCIGSSWAELVNWLPGTIEAAQDIVKQQIEGKLDFQQFEMSFIHPDNTLRTLHTSNHPVKDDSGKVIAIDGIIEDITERIESQEKIRLAASVFAHSKEGIFIADKDNHIIDVNPACLELTGYTREEVIGKTPKIFASGTQTKAFYAQMWKTLLGSGHWQGEIWNRRKSGEIYSERLSIDVVSDAQGKIQHFVAVFYDITHLKEYEAELEHNAYNDALTELPNRLLLRDRMQQAISKATRSKKILAICYLDLDGFKPVNDTYGHRAGDEILIEVAKRLLHNVRADDTVARIGGDEFVLIMQDINVIDELKQALKRILSSISSNYSLTENEITQHIDTISASIGVTLYAQDGYETDVLLRHADQAMYQAKQSGKNCYCFFDTKGQQH